MRMNSLLHSTEPSDLSMGLAVRFGRDICSDIEQSTGREWLVTNGIGGYGCGTISGMLTRCYHGMLVAALNPPLGRTLLLAKLDETVHYLGKPFPLSCDRWSGGTTTGHGYRNLEGFHLEGTIPTWTYTCADARLQKRVWMQQGENTTYVQYKLERASAPFNLVVKALVNHRDHHCVTKSQQGLKTWRFGMRSHPRGLKISAEECAVPFYLVTTRGQLVPQDKWYQDYFLTQEKYRGLAHLDDHLHCASLRTTLAVGETVTVACSTQPFPNLDEAMAIDERIRYEQGLLEKADFEKDYLDADLQQMILAADQFVVDRTDNSTQAKEITGKTIIAGYPWFGDWGRDTMIALPGLTLATGRAELARPILLTFAQYLDKGMLPNAFPEVGDTPGYNTVDAILWYFEAIRAYVSETDDVTLLLDLFPALEEVVDWHLRGTRYNIHLDQTDGLLYAGTESEQLTWMDAKVDDWVVTPRIGKPIEINALWYNALLCMAEFCDRLGESTGEESSHSVEDISVRDGSGEEHDAFETRSVDYQKQKADYLALARFVEASFSKFWNAELGYCYDVIDGPSGNDSSLRPNQLFAVSLFYASPLSEAQRKSIVDVCAQQLLTSYGMRSLAPAHADYVGVYGGDRYKRDGSYHQGTTWGWLLGPFVQAHLKVYKDSEVAAQLLEPMIQHISAGCVGTLSEIFDGDAPFFARGAFSQAWSVAEVLRVMRLIRQAQSKEQA